MDEKILALIKELEQLYGSPVQISIERPKKTEQIMRVGNYQRLFFPADRQLYGSWKRRACEIFPIPTEDHEIKHDLSLLEGKYDSLYNLNKEIKKIERLELLCIHGLDFDQGLRNHLATKYEVKEKVVGIAHGGQADWYTVDGTEADLGDWKTKRPDLFKESVQYLESNKVPFWYHDLVATPHGIYISENNYFGTFGDNDVLRSYFGTNELETLTLTQKIAGIKLELLK